GYPEIAAYVRRFEGIEWHEHEKLVREICQITPDYDLVYVGIEGNRNHRIFDAKIQLPVSSRDDRLMLQMTCSPQEIITYESWYFWCLPQILGHFLLRTAFGDIKPIHELDYSMGFSLSDYDRIGFA